MFSHRINEELELGLLEKQHAEKLYQLTNTSRTYLRRWLPWVDVTNSVEDTKGFIQGTLEQFSRNNGFQAGIWYRGELTGVVGLHTIDWENRSTSIGYWLGETYQGNGIITQSCRAVTDYCFKELQLNRIELRTAVANEKSQAVAKRLGFTYEGLLRQCERLPQGYADVYVYSLIRDDTMSSYT